MNAFQIYLVCFGVGFLFTIVGALMADVFGGHDAHVDIGSGGHAEGGFGSHEMPGFSPLSPTTLATFVTAFGGLGMIFTQVAATQSPWLSAPLSAIGGFGIAAGVVKVFQSIFKRTQSSSESHVSTLAGSAATVITPIPENGVGEIAYVQSGTRYSAPAREEHGVPIPNGHTVKITRVVGTQFYVTSV